MTITTELARMPAHAGDGSTTQFAYAFRIIDDGELLVILRDQDGNETQQVKGSDYTVTGAGDADGGSVIFSTPPSVGNQVHIILNPEYTQLVDLVADDLEKLGDKLTQQNKRSKDLAERTLRLNDTEPLSGNFDAGGRGLGGLADGVEDDDAMTVGQAQSYVDAAAAQAAVAESRVSDAQAAQAAAEEAAANSENARIAAENAFDLFDDRMLGAHASDPATDNDGNPLQEGSIYFNTTIDKWKSYRNGSWFALIPEDVVTGFNGRTGEIQPQAGDYAGHYAATSHVHAASEITDLAAQLSASSILTKLITVDGAGSGLDADLWQGKQHTVSTGEPSGGADGDFWFQREI
jgi:hypothetical protein